MSETGPTPLFDMLLTGAPAIDRHSVGESLGNQRRV